MHEDGTDKVIDNTKAATAALRAVDGRVAEVEATLAMTCRRVGV